MSLALGTPDHRRDASSRISVISSVSVTAFARGDGVWRAAGRRRERERVDFVVGLDVDEDAWPVGVAGSGEGGVDDVGEGLCCGPLPWAAEVLVVPEPLIEGDLQPVDGREVWASACR